MSVHTKTKERNTELALRRLRYLHTSLTQKKTQQDARLRKLWVIDSKEENVFTPTSTASNQHFVHNCVLSLEPQNGNKEKREKNAKADSKSKKNVRIGSKPVYHKRAPLIRPTAFFSPTFTLHSLSRPAQNKCNQRSSSANYRVSKSSTSLLDPNEDECRQSFLNDLSGSNKETSRKYSTDIRIGRVSFSARPMTQRRCASFRSACRPERKSSNRKVIPLPTESYYEGWGMRTKREIRTATEELSLGSPLEVTAGLRTLTLEYNSIQDKYAHPPTPIQQIDIKLPEGKIIKNRFAESLAMNV